MAKYTVTYDGVHYGQTILNKYGEQVKFVPIGKDFDIMDITQNLDTEVIMLQIATTYAGQNVLFDISRMEALSQSRLARYANIGLDVCAYYADVAVEAMRQKEKDYYGSGNKLHYRHSVLGWREDEKKGLVFCADKSNILHSEYDGYFDLSKKGTFKDWHKFITRYVTGHTPLEFALVVGFASILLGFLENDCDCDNFIVHMVGDSSTGKSTALALTASIFGNPRIGNNTLIASWNGTDNAISTRGRTLKGFFLGLDELTIQDKTKDLAKMVYSLSMGLEKVRLNPDGTPKDTKKGTYILMSNGETSLLNRCAKLSGVGVRVLEFRKNQWTKSAKQSEKIKRGTKKFHGTAARIFGSRLRNYVKENGKDTLPKRYEELRKLYCNKCTIEERKERMSGRYALLLLATELCNELLDFSFDMDAILQFILDNENVVKRHDLTQFYALFKGAVNHYSHKFCDGKHQPNEAWGKFENVKPSQCKNLPDNLTPVKTVVITQKAMSDLVYRLGFDDCENIIQHLKSMGVLSMEGGTHTKTRRTIKKGDLVEDCYVIILADEN